MSKTPLTAEAVYKLTNMLVSDGTSVLVFNAVYEVMTDALTAVNPELEARIDDDSKLACVIGYALHSDHEFVLSRVFGAEPDRRAGILDLAIAAIEQLPEPEDEDPLNVEIDALPTTLAAMVVWSAPEGLMWTSFYRHSEIPEPAAASLLKAAVRRLKGEEPDDLAN